MKILLADEVEYLIGRLGAAGYGAWAVGGCVRDGCLGREIHDWDVCTSARPEQMEQALSGERIIRTGAEHGTLTIVISGVPIETTTLRSDGAYRDHRRPENVAFVDSLALDLARRDFTVNSMAYNDADGLIDPFNGLNDLKAAVIKCVGNARQRFSEDALRILRAVRFASRLDFRIDSATAEAARDMRGDLSFVSRERVLAEIVKLLQGKASSRAALEYSDIIRAALSVEKIDTDFAYLPRDACLALAALLGKAAPDAVKSLRASSSMRARVTNLCALLDRAPVQTERDALWLFREAKSDQAAFDLAEYWKCKGVSFNREAVIAASRKCHGVRGLDINGDDLINLGYTGKAVGRALEELLSEVMRGNIENRREELYYKAAKAIDIEGNL